MAAPHSGAGAWSKSRYLIIANAHLSKTVDTTLSKQDREELGLDKDIEETDLAVGAVGSEGERPAGRRGPEPALGDEDLLAAIRRDLARSPWAGEGHRKVWARLRVIDGIRVGRTRVLRSMGENGLLSPHRRPPGPANDHDGAITTAAPNVMWGADGAVIPTVEDGNVTLFIVAEHWNAVSRLARRQARQPSCCRRGAGIGRQPGLRLRPFDEIADRNRVQLRNISVAGYYPLPQAVTGSHRATSHQSPRSYQKVPAIERTIADPQQQRRRAGEQANSRRRKRGSGWKPRRARLPKNSNEMHNSGESTGRGTASSRGGGHSHAEDGPL